MKRQIPLNINIEFTLINPKLPMKALKYNRIRTLMHPLTRRFQGNSITPYTHTVLRK